MRQVGQKKDQIIHLKRDGERERERERERDRQNEAKHTHGEPRTGGKPSREEESKGGKQTGVTEQEKESGTGSA